MRSLAAGFVASTGSAPIDDALPWGGLPQGLHEIAAPAGDAAGIGFAAALLGARQGRVLWCRSRRAAMDTGAAYGFGLAGLGFAPGRLILVEADKPADLFWAMEEWLRGQGQACVLGEGVAPDLTSSRRLQLAAEAKGGMVLLLSVLTAEQKAPVLSAPVLSAMTRWRATSLPSVPEAGGPGRPRWRLELWRCRGGGRPRDWIVEWDDAAFSLSVVSPLADRPLAAATG